MNTNNFNDRKVDKFNVDKSKQYLWKYISEKKGLGAMTAKAKDKTEGESWFFRIFSVKKVAFVSSIAVLTIIAVLFGPNLQRLMQGDITGSAQIANASFTMTADSEDSAGVNSNSSFTLTSTEDFDAALIEANLQTTPKVDLNITKTGEGVYKVTPAQNLEMNQIYSFAIFSTNEGLTEEFSWAYQVKDEFKIYGSMPGDETSGVPLNSGIEINFSHENYDFENIKNYVEITPSIEFKTEKHNRTVVFVPQGGLTKGTIYTVTIKAGLALIESDKTLKEDYTFTFETGDTMSGYKSSFKFVEDHYEIGTNQPVAMFVSHYATNRDIAISNDVNLKVYKFKSIDDYLNVVKEKNQLPDWANYALTNYNYDLTKLNYLGEYEAKVEEINYKRFVHAPTASLEEGYYVFLGTNEDRTSKALVQVTNLSSYVSATKDGTIVWVNDIKTGQPINGANVEVIGENKSVKTNAEGIATFNIPLREKNNLILKISAPDGQVQITNVVLNRWAKEGSYLGDFWYTFSTDRPVYQPDDRIQFWGFLKAKNNNAKVEDLRVELSQGYWGPRTFAAQIEIQPSKNDTFRGYIDINDMPSGSFNLSVYNGDKLLTSEYISIQTYKKPTYEIAVETDKRAMFYDENTHVQVNSRFFEGTPVPNLKLYYNTTDEIRTDENGFYEFDFTPSTDITCTLDSYYCSNYESKYLSFDPVPKEDSMIGGSTYLRVFNSRIDVSGAAETKDNLATVTINTNWVDLDKLNNDENSYYYDYLGKTAPNREVKGKITENWTERIETGEYYDFINKRTEKTYKYENRKNDLGTFAVETDGNGRATHQFKMTEGRYYNIRFETKDNEGRSAFGGTYAYNRGDSGSEWVHIKVLNHESDYGPYKFKTGATVETGIASGDNLLPEGTEGKFLFIQYNNGLSEYAVKSNPQYNFKMSANQVPGALLEAVWFDGNSYKLAWGETIYFESSEKAINIDLKPTKDSYEPGEKATMKVKTTDINGNPVKAEVLLNLVDEAYYNLFFESAQNPLDELYGYVTSGKFGEFQSHKNALETADAGMGGCFAEGTRILMADGSLKNIEDIAAGDYILTKESPYSSEMVKAKVLKTVEHDVVEYLIINEGLKVTAEHVVFVNNKFNLAGKIQVGDVMLGSDGQMIKVESIRKEVTPVKVYNFEVEHYHTYFADGYYVHNDKGGEARSDFEDTALFKSIETNGSGDGEITFELPDNITGWRVTALAIDPVDLKAGRGSGSVKVTLPFFADFVMNTEYSVKDEPWIGVRAYGTDVNADSNVDFTVYADSLGLEESDTITGKAYKAIDFEMPKLTLGEHEIQLDAKAGNLEDSLIEKFEVKGSRLKESKIDLIPTVTETTKLPIPDEGYSEIYFMNAGVAGFYGDLLGLYYERGERLEGVVGEKAATELINEYFGVNFGTRRDINLEDYQHSNGLLRLLPYGEGDLKLTALTVAMDPNPKRFREADISNYLNGVYKNTNSNLEEVVLSLMALASLDEPVLNSLRTIKDVPELDLAEKIYIGIGFANLGSKADAKEMYNLIKNELKDGNTYETTLGAVLASAIGERDDAVLLWDYVYKNPDKDDVLNLYKLGYLKFALKYANPDDVKFKIQIGDAIKDVQLGKCETFSTLAGKTKGVSLSGIEGDLAAVAYYENAIEPSQFKKDERIKLTRSYKVDGVETTEFKEGDIIEVRLTINAEGVSEDAYFKIVDVLPSGLKVLSGSNAPYNVYNQEVHYGWSTKSYTNYIRYFATVVNTGKFYADPARIYEYSDPSFANITEPAYVTIDNL